MRPSLVRAILQLYGESPVLDPMAGVGTTLIEAMLLGMDAVGIEYEQKFVVQVNKNIQHVQKIFKDRKLGKAVCIKGDARNLSCLNNPKVNSIVFSPPYFDALSTTKASHKSDFALKKKLPTHYSTNRQNIGNLQSFGSIIFSPPFGEANRGSGIAKEGYKGKYGINKRVKERCDKPISKDKHNISNIRFGKTYLSEMFKVYSECFKVLKPGKFMVVVVKDLRRKRLTIPLGAETIKLIQLAGFEIFDIIISKLNLPSFWVLNYAIKTQAKGIPLSLRNFEYVIVARKPYDEQ